MSRISFERKSPEGWRLTLKRMIRPYEVRPTAEEARAIVRTLADRHGLAREEAEQGMYEVERRVRWEEKVPNEDVREALTRCHTLGRIVLRRRTPKEWRLLKATHLAFFPVAEFTAFRASDRGPGGRVPAGRVRERRSRARRSWSGARSSGRISPTAPTRRWTTSPRPSSSSPRSGARPSPTAASRASKGPGSSPGSAPAWDGPSAR